MRGYQTQQLRVTSCDALKCAFLQRHGNHWSNPTGSCKVSNPEDRVYVVLVVRKTKVDASVKTQKYFHTTWHGSQVKIPVLWRKCQRTRAGEKMRIKKGSERWILNPHPLTVSSLNNVYRALFFSTNCKMVGGKAACICLPFYFLFLFFYANQLLSSIRRKHFRGCNFIL